MSHKPDGWTILVQDESIWTHERTLKRVWAKRGTRPRVLVTGSTRKTCVYGALTDNGRQCFRHYERCNSQYFIDFLKTLLRTHAKLILFLDRAPWHRSKATLRFVRNHSTRLRIRWFPVGFPEANPVEETWRQGKQADTLGAAWHDSFRAFTEAISAYYRTRRFNLNLLHYLCQ